MGRALTRGEIGLVMAIMVMTGLFMWTYVSYEELAKSYVALEDEQGKL